MKDDTCYRCGGCESDTILRIDGTASIVKCRRCGLARTHPYPIFNFTSQDKYSDFYLENENLFRSFARSMMDVVRGHKTSGSFLDIGCAVGYLLDEARQAGFAETVGIELNKSAALAASGKGHKIYSEPLESLDTAGKKFDVISFNHVLEHVMEFKPFLEHVKNILKPDGIIYCGVPNYNSFMRRLLGGSWYGWGMPDHIWHFDPGTFQSVMNDAGFSSKVFIKNSLYYPYSKSLRKNTRATIARIACHLGLGDQVYGIFVYLH